MANNHKIKKINCWEFKKCGREPGGIHALKLGICPVPLEINANSINDGQNGGRACWAIAGTFCDGKVQGTFAQKFASCVECEFYKVVLKEEGKNYQGAGVILERLKSKAS